MTAGLAAMELFDDAAAAHVNGLAARAKKGIEKAIQTTGVCACVTGAGSLFRVHLKDAPPSNYREAFIHPEGNRQLTVLLDHLYDEGFVMINTCSATISTVMGEAEIDLLVAAMESGFEKVMASA